MTIALQRLNRLVFLIFLTASFQCATADLLLQPNPALSPTDVVHFQLAALRADTDGDGIAATYRFASEANKLTTGPLRKFSRLFDNLRYRPMLNHRSARIELLAENGRSAEVVTGIVDSNGKLHWYRFTLSRQQIAPHLNCWMTDAVMLEVRAENSA